MMSTEMMATGMSISVPHTPKNRMYPADICRGQLRSVKMVAGQWPSLGVQGHICTHVCTRRCFSSPQNRSLSRTTRSRSPPAPDLTPECAADWPAVRAVFNRDRRHLHKSIHTKEVYLPKRSHLTPEGHKIRLCWARSQM